MNWWGKLLGSSFGFLMGGPLGAMVGAAIGHNFDASLRRIVSSDSQVEERERRHAVFLDTTFQVMGYIAKRDGRVSENEIAVAQAIMTQLQLTQTQRQAMISTFQEGKQVDFNLEAALSRFHHHCGNHPHLVRQFMEIQLGMAYADGVPHPSKRALLLLICTRIGFSRLRLETLEINLRNRFQQAGARQGSRRAAGEEFKSQQAGSLAAAYATLGLKRDATNEEVKMAYRRLINRHHPDKHAAKGLTEEATKKATEKTREIQAAYEQIKEARGS